MKRWAGQVSAAASVAMLCMSAGPVWADDPTTSGDRAELEVLKARIEKLEHKIADQDTKETLSAPPPQTAGIALPSGLQGVQMSGFADASFTYNLNNPQNRTNALRVFDTRANSFMLNNAELVIEKPVSSESRTGFRTDLDFGTDSEVVGTVTSGLGSGSDELDIQQAYAEYLAPIGNGVDIKAGKFVTLHGAEVIESKDNWNISRSYLFGYAIPFTHTGIRVNYPWSDTFSTVVGVNNGWDIVDDNNQAKTVEMGFSATPIEHVSLGTTFMTGAEQTNNNGKQRQLLDIVAGYQPIEPLQLKLNYDYGWEDDAAATVAFTNNNAVWQGLAAYAHYALTDRAALSLRGEFFNDMDGVRTGVATGLNSVTSAGIKVYECTLTGEYKIFKNLVGRLEYRHDRANEKVFRNRDLSQRSYQDTVAVEFIAPF